MQWISISKCVSHFIANASLFDYMQGGATLGALLAMQESGKAASSQPAPAAAAATSPEGAGLAAPENIMRRLQLMRDMCNTAMGPNLPPHIAQEFGTAFVESLSVISAFRTMQEDMQKMQDRYELS